MRPRSPVVVVLLAILPILPSLVACGGGARSATVEPNNRASELAKLYGSRTCPLEVDLGDLLKRNARDFGSEAAIASYLPRAFAGETIVNDSRGRFEVRFDRGRHRKDTMIGGIPLASGSDEKGPWIIGIPGVVHRLRDDEAQSVKVAVWIARRNYLSNLDLRRDAARCEMKDTTARVTVTTKLPQLGDPELVFDLATARLLSVSHARPEGQRDTTEILEWSEAESEVRWPTKWLERSETGSLTVFSVRATTDKVTCGEVCMHPPPDAFTFTWPKEDRFVVPMAYHGGEITLRANVGGRDLWAFFDSGASVSAVDSTTPLGASFKAAVSVEGSSSTQKVTAGLGEIRDVSIGGAAMTRLPVVSLPIPALDNFGTRRPELILGYSLVAAAPVRVDFAKSELVFAKDAGALHGASAIALPLHYWDGKLVTEVDVDGQRGLIEIDTGDSGGVSLFKRWASAHGFPGDRKTTELRHRSGAGTAETNSVFMRAKKSVLGPIVVEDHRVSIDDPPSGANLAGLAGNELFAKCTAIVFDVAKRTLWLEPPCDRAIPEALGGWQLAYAPDPSFADRPWVVGKMLPGGSAEKAQLRPTDRVLTIGGKPAILDKSTFETVLSKPPGTKVDIQIVRDGKKQTIKMELFRP